MIAFRDCILMAGLTISYFGDACALTAVSTDSGCQIQLSTIPPPNTLIQWSGLCVNGTADGRGTLQLNNESELLFFEGGTMAKGQRVGIWRRIYEQLGFEFRMTYENGEPKKIEVDKVKNFTESRNNDALNAATAIIHHGDFAVGNNPSTINQASSGQAVQMPSTQSSRQTLATQGPPVVVAGSTQTQPVVPTPPQNQSQARTQIAPTSQSAQQASSTQNPCGGELITKVEEQGNGVVTLRRYRVLAISPLQIEVTAGQSYRQDLNIPGVPRKQAGQVDWLDTASYGSSNLRSIVEDSEAESRRYLTCSSSSNLCASHVTELTQKRDWHRCLLEAANSFSGPAVPVDMDTVTPPVPGCPKYLRKSLVTWRQVGNPQLNTWEIRNQSNRTLKVTFSEGGSNSSSDTLPPGQSTQVGLFSSQVPAYVVRDFDELFAFNRANGTNGKTLQCDLAIRPR